MIKVLGSYGNRAKHAFTTAFLLREDIVIDAGNLANGLGDDVVRLEHILLTHSHFDHIIDLPFVIDTSFAERKKTLKIYGLKETIDSIKDLFNNQIWPDFTKISLPNGKQAVEFIEIKIGDKLIFDNIKVKILPANHTVAAVGFKITKNNKSVILSGDTYLNDKLIEEINNTKNLQAILIECSFPSELDVLAKDSKHLTPKLIFDLSKKIKKDIDFYFYHFKKEYKNKIIDELYNFNLLKKPEYILEDGMCIYPFGDNGKCIFTNSNLYKQELKKLMDISLELSSETNVDYFLEDVLSVAREFTLADGGSLYLKKGDKLYFKIIQNETLKTFMGGRQGPIEWEPLEIYTDGKENRHMVAVLCALTQKIYNIADVYLDDTFDFSGTKEFDKVTGYRSKSMLVIPLIDHKKETIGILQLINKKENNFILPFNKDDEDITLSLASQAAISITKNKLIDNLESFIESFINVIAKAVDEKSKYTGNHVQKVATLAEIISNSINKDKEYFKDVNYDDNMLKQIKIAALLHDIGKITTDPRTMDKATKLEANIDRIKLIEERFEIIKRDYLLAGKKDLKEIDDDLEFLEEVNKGGEYLEDSKIKRIENIATKYQYELGGKKVNVLRDDEVEMLKIRKGTLSDKEREHVQRHALMTYEMLSGLPFPTEYQEIVHIASNHHEKLNGQGYPRQLSEKELTLEDRILAICDIFEALTASDRPYKTPKKLSEVFKIMNNMAKDRDIDEKVLEFFIKKRIWKKYEKYLLPSQIDVE